MRRVMAVLMLLCVSCVDRTENLDFSTNASVELEIPEMVTTDGGIGGIEGRKTVENGRMPKEKYNNGTSEATEATGKEENATYSSENGAKTASNHTDRESISEAVFYIFDENGLFMSKNIFAGGDDYKLNFTKNGRHSVYVLCNISEFADLPASPSQDELESLTVPHRESYDRLPFAGKTEVNVTPGEKPAIRIKLDRINSAIRIENRSADRMELTRITVNGLPNRGNIFGTDTEAADVTYSESAEAEIDADGNAVVYSFFVPENKIANVKIEAEARVKDTEGTTAATIAPLTFIDRLETGKQATALVGYMESGNIKIGSPDNWGNVGKYELPGGVRLQVVGGEFFDYKSAKALRAYSGGSEFSFVVEAADGVATLQTVGTAEWIEIRDNIIVVSANPAAAERECQVSVSVGGKNVGVFYIVQGKAITFSCSSLAITDNKLEKVGGTGSGSAVYTATFDMSDDELAATEIAPEGNGENGVTVEVNRSAKTVSVYFMALVDASQVGAEGVSVPVRFLDVNGTEQACLEVVQRPAKITFNPVRYKNISYLGGTVTASVTVEGDAKWNVNGILDKGGKPVDAWLTGPATGEQFDSGSNLVLTVSPNGTSAGRTAYVTVKSRYTLSKPYEITQAPSYGVKNISSDVGWDDESATLKAYSKGRIYTFSFDTEIAIPEHIKLAVECGSESDITASEITNTSGNSYTFTLTVPDSDNTEEEVTSVTDITADGTPIGSFTVLRAYKPQFISMETSVWGGVKDRPQLKNVTYRASEWDLKDFVSSNGKLPVSRSTNEIAVVSYAETLTYDAEAQTATITMNLNGGNSVSYTTTQAPVAFTISDADLAKLENVVKEGGDIGGITVTTQAGSVGTPWRVASASATWLTTDPAIDGTETNASGSTLTVTFAANTGGDRTGSFVLESRNTTSPAYAVSQRGTFGVTVSSVTYNGKTALFADDMLKAFSVGYDYTFNITTDNAITGSRLNITGKTTGSAVTVKTQPNGTDLKTSHSFVISVPASTLTTEPESTFDIMVDGNRIGGFTVKQAKKAGFAASTSTVNVTSVTGGVKSRPTLKNGSFVASEWDVSGVTSSNGSLPVSAVNVAAGTFKVGFAETLTSTSAAQSATITLDGADGTSRGSYSTTQKKVTFTFNPTSYTFPGQASLTQNIAVTTDAGAEWSVASNTNSAAISSTKSGSNLVLKTVADAPTTSDATANITLTLNDCTSQVFVAKQLRAMSATFTAPSGCVYANNTLSAYSAAKTYDFTLALNRAVDASKISIVRTSGSLAVPTLTTTGSKTSHTVRVSVPASTTTTEPTSTFTITVDGDLVQTFTVKQAKKPSISVSTATVIGGSSAVSGSFTASTWDVKSSAYVTSSNSNMGITLPSSNNGTFTVGMAANMDQTFTNRSATITLVGVTGNLATCSIAQNKVVYAFSPTAGVAFKYNETTTGKTVTVTSSNAGTISSGMTATSSQTWCTVSVNGNKVTAKVTENTGNTSRTATVYVTYRNSRSQTFTVTQEAGGPATVTIGGLQWTLYNLANPAQASGGAKFATKLPSQCTGNRAESHGRFYQWNRNVSWNTIGSSASGANPSGTWQTTNPSGTSWTTTPCPSGFRLPTNTEFQNLINACNATYRSGSWSSSNYGYLTLTDKSNSANKLEFPAVGYRRTDSAGTLYHYGTTGYYWSSVQYTSNTSNAHNLFFNSSSVNPSEYNNKQNGFSVRCVRQ